MWLTHGVHMGWHICFRQGTRCDLHLIFTCLARDIHVICLKIIFLEETDWGWHLALMTVFRESYIKHIANTCFTPALSPDLLTVSSQFVQFAYDSLLNQTWLPHDWNTAYSCFTHGLLTMCKLLICTWLQQKNRNTHAFLDHQLLQSHAHTWTTLSHFIHMERCCNILTARCQHNAFPQIIS